jgi:threonylcarbamoyladenosine tRNA methylthiotransferase MtaB
MARQFQMQGHEIVNAPELADEIIVNTCAVTEDAVRSSRRLIHQLNRTNNHASVTVTGCYAQIALEDVTVLPGVKNVVDNLGKDELVSTIAGQPAEPFDHEPIAREMPAWIGRTRAFIKVQDGCDNACTFCVTTIARGAGRSRSISDVINEIRMLHGMGYQEAVLTGVHLGSYGHDFGDSKGLFHLIRAILAETDIPRLRLSSLEPWDLTPAFFTLWDNPRLCPHLHLPLQSGCDATLRRMARRTNQRRFRTLVAEARAHIPNPCITTDVIVGFPGETEDEFAASVEFVEMIGFAGLHVFRYSQRPGTAAARMRGHVNEDVKKARSARLLALSDAIERRYCEYHCGKQLPVLWEQVAGASEGGFFNVGYTPNYIRVACTHPRALTNLITSVELNKFDPEKRQMIGTPLLN